MKFIKPFNLCQELLKSNAVERGRLLGLDVGDRYIGLAVSDASHKIASPLSVLVRKEDNIDMMATDFQSLMSHLHLSALIIGYPFHRIKNSPDAFQVKLFVDDLRDTGKLDGLRYTFWNEGFTSKSVELMLQPLNLHPSQAKTMNDKFAAVGILQAYLDFANRYMESKFV